MALKSDKSIEAYEEIMGSEDEPPGPKIDELSPERQAWYRA